MADKNLFTPSKISKMTPSEINKAYSRLRSIANKRIGRLEAQGLNRGNGPFATIQQIKDSSKWDIGSQLAEVSRFLRSDRTTVSGTKRYMREFQEQMQVRGYGDLVSTPQGILNMIDYMEALRERHSDKIFDSGDALDVLQEGQRLKIPTEKMVEHYDEFATNLSKLEKIQPSKNGREFSQRRINNLIKKWSN